MTLEQLAVKYGTDKAEHGYCGHYERHLTNVASLLEIGIGAGGSLRMWQEWLPDARIVGVDNDPDCIYGDCECIFGEATRAATFQVYDTFDVVIDDGSHQAIDVITSFYLLWPKLNVGGWYVIEDLACVRHPQFGGDEYGGPVMRLLSDLALHAVRADSELHIYEEIAFIRKLT